MRSRITLLVLVFFFLQNNAQNLQNVVWESLGPEMNQMQNKNWKWIGRAESIWVNPNDTSIIYLGINNGGLYKTENGGQSWRLLTEEYSFGVQRIIVKPDNFNTMFISTRCFANSYTGHGQYSYGILKSLDAGETWEKVTGIEPEDLIFISDIEYHPTDYNIMYAVGQNMIYKSFDGGDSWEVLNAAPYYKKGKFRNIAINPVSPNIIVVSGEKELIRSTDNGNKWEDISGELTKGIKTRIEIDYTPSGKLMSLHFLDRKNFFGVSQNNGDSWSIKNVGYIGAKKGVRFLKVVTDSVIWAGGTRPWKSTDVGDTFTPMDDGYYGNVHPDIRDICFPLESNLDVVYVATDGGIERNLTPGKKTWDILNGNLALNECYTVSISENNPEIMLIGTHDNGSYARYKDGTWRHVKGGDGGSTLISHNYDKDKTAFVTGNYPLMRSTNGIDGRYKTVFKRGIWLDVPLLQHPKDSATIYYAKNEYVHKSEDYGENWTDWGIEGSGRISAMGISKSNSNIFFYSKRDYDYKKKELPYTVSLWKTEDNGYSWSNLTKNISLLNPKIITEVSFSEIEIHPENSDIVWLSLGDFLSGYKLIQTTNGGETWKNITYNLTNIPANSIKYYDEKDFLFLATDIGIFYLANVSNPEKEHKWRRVGNFPNIIVSDIKINHSARQIIVATYGRGIWRANLMEVETGE